MNKEMHSRIQSVFGNVKRAAEQSGRSFSDITIVGVSKKQPIELISEAYAAGIRVFGENRAQEFRDKFGIIKQTIEWHFIGHLQKNKIKYVLGKVDLIHSVDSIELARALNAGSEAKGLISNVLLELKVSMDEAKTGFEPRQIEEVALQCRDLQNLNVKGLMAMSTFTNDVSVIRSQFAEAHDCFNDLKPRMGKSFEYLSMGMSNDYEIAIEEGSNMVRIGTAIFGPRP